MALSSTVVWEVRTTGNDNNGGGFNSAAAGVDRSQQDAAHATLTTASTVHTTTTQINVDAGDHTVSADDVGNILKITGGTATAGRYQITAADVGNNRWTVDRSAGSSGQTVEGSMGGACSSPGEVAGSMVASNIVHVKSGTYSVANGTANTSGNVVFTNLGNTKWIGYETTRLDDSATRPLLQATANSMIIMRLNTGPATVRNIEFGKSAAETSVTGLMTDGEHDLVYKCRANNLATGFSHGISPGFEIGGKFVRCSTLDCTIGFQGGVRGTKFVECVAKNGTTGFDLSNYGSAVRCIATGFTQTGFDCTATNNSCVACIADAGSGTTSGFLGSGTNAGFVSSCVSKDCTDGFKDFSASASFLFDCAGYNNTNDTPDVTANQNIDFIELSADPFVDAANDDYNINNTAGGGALLRDATVTMPEL